VGADQHEAAVMMGFISKECGTCGTCMFGCMGKGVDGRWANVAVDATAQACMMRRMKPLAAMLQSHVGVLLIRM
jgi:hypothetical protein